MLGLCKQRSELSELLQQETQQHVCVLCFAVCGVTIHYCHFEDPLLAFCQGKWTYAWTIQWASSGDL